MKTNLFVNRTTVCMKSVILLCMALLLPSAIAGKGKNSQKKVISYVDTSLNGSQKYVLRVDDKPFCTMAEARPIANSRLCDALSESR